MVVLDNGNEGISAVIESTTGRRLDQGISDHNVHVGLVHLVQIDLYFNQKPCGQQKVYSWSRKVKRRRNVGTFEVLYNLMGGREQDKDWLPWQRSFF